jgi:1,4-alpha-glucan branching enzyme
MLKRRKISGSNTIKVSFILPADDSRLPASVVGDFNEWNTEADPMVRRSNGTYSAVVALVGDASYRFRYRPTSTARPTASSSFNPGGHKARPYDNTVSYW